MQNQTQEATYPWLKLWIKPRNSLRSLLTHHPKRFTLLLSLIYGIASAFLWFRFLVITYPTQPTFAHPLAFLAVPFVGILLGLIYLYFNSWLYRITGSWVGGKGTYTDVKCAVGWSAYPMTIALILSFLPLLFAASPILSFLFSLAYLVVAIWSMILWFNLIAEAHQFSFWKAVLSFLIAFALLFVFVMLVIIIIPLISPLFR